MGYRVVITLATLVVVFLMVSCSNASAPGGGGGGGGGNAGTQAISKGDLVRAVLKNDLLLVEDLLRKGADPNENVGDKEDAITPLMAAVAQGNTAIALLLLDRSIATYPTFQGYSALNFAIYSLGEKSEITRELMAKY